MVYASRGSRKRPAQTAGSYNGVEGDTAMPLRDHFRPPLAELRSWEELHGAWPGSIAFRLNAILPPDYYCGPRVHLGSVIEIDVATFQDEESLGATADRGGGSTAVAWAPPRPTLLLDTESPTPPEYYARVYD